jgi:hypothetical protein
MLEYRGKKFTFIPSNASLQCSFLINGNGGMILSIFDSILKFLKGEILVPDRLDPDPTILCGSHPIRTHNTANI